ncbi:MAG TPA: cellulase family glycosylhydrolase [Pelobium sp.]|nr:cellulase family glycosylhydrolase [Pelobium sp.]
MSFSAIFISSCKKDDESPIPEFLVSTESLNFTNQAETKFFHVQSNMKWNAVSSESWLTLASTTGTSGTTKVEVSATANSQVIDRTAIITITVGDQTKKINVLQSASSLFSIDKSTATLTSDFQEFTLNVESNSAYTVEFGGDWLSRKAEPVKSGTTYTETFIVRRNGNIFDRTADIIFKKGTETITSAIQQSANAKNVAPITTGVASDAQTLAAKMKIGWNLGNSLEAAASSTSANELLWGNAKTTKLLIDGVKAAGFDAIRVPCAWSGYIEDQTTFKIKDSWLGRVKEVVDYCTANDMYVILNIHWDGGWLEENPTFAAQASVNLKQKALWEQIAVYFRDYDEHLLFAGTNEVHANYGTPTAENITVQQSYNQTFVNAVRATGGRNANRNLIVQAYNTNIDYAVNKFTMPNDATAKRLMTEVHFYDPFDFALDENSDKYLWGKDFGGSPNAPSWGQEAWVDTQFANVKAKFIDVGIPVILGEYGAILRNVGVKQADHVKARNYYLSYVTKAAIKNGMIPFYWDSGFTGTNGMGLFNRSNGQVEHQDALNAIIDAAQ